MQSTEKMQEHLIEWLRDAHAAEKQAKTMLSGTADRLERYPQFSAGLRQHAEQSGRQADQLEQCLSGLGENTSLIKQVTGKVTAVGQTLSGLVVGDEVIKAALAISTYAEMEISSYRILIAAAQACGASHVATVCERLLNEKLEFHRWIEQQLPTLTEEYLRREERASSSAAP